MKDLGQSSRRPVAEGETLESSGQAFPRSGRNMKRRGTASYNMNGNPLAAKAVPLPLKLCRPVGKAMDFIQHQYGWSVLGTCFRIRPAPLPETGQRGTRIIARGIHRLIAKLPGKLQQERGLAHLPRSGQDLNSAGRGFTQPFLQHLPAVIVAVLQYNHNRIIIRLYRRIGQERFPVPTNINAEKLAQNRSLLVGPLSYRVRCSNGPTWPSTRSCLRTCRFVSISSFSRGGFNAVGCTLARPRSI